MSAKHDFHEEIAISIPCLWYILQIWMSGNEQMTYFAVRDMGPMPWPEWLGNTITWQPVMDNRRRHWPARAPPAVPGPSHCKTHTFKSKEISFKYSKAYGISRLKGIFPSNIGVGTAAQTGIRRKFSLDSTGSTNLRVFLRFKALSFAVQANLFIILPEFFEQAPES